MPIKSPKFAASQVKSVVPLTVQHLQKIAPLDVNYPKFLVKNINSNKGRNDNMTMLKKVT